MVKSGGKANLIGGPSAVLGGGRPVRFPPIQAARLRKSFGKRCKFG